MQGASKRAEECPWRRKGMWKETRSFLKTKRLFLKSCLNERLRTLQHLGSNSLAWHLGFSGPWDERTQGARFSSEDKGRLSSPLPFLLAVFVPLWAMPGKTWLQPNFDWLSKSYGICCLAEKVTETPGWEDTKDTWINLRDWPSSEMS